MCGPKLSDKPADISSELIFEITISLYRKQKHLSYVVSPLTAEEEEEGISTAAGVWKETRVLDDDTTDDDSADDASIRPKEATR